MQIKTKQKNGKGAKANTYASRTREVKSKYTVGNFKLSVHRGVSGKGLFAKEDIPKGVCLIEYTGEPISKEKQKTATGRYLFETGRGKMINGNVKSNTARYINHSCKPNCEAEGPSGRVFIMSLRKIKAGEEITYDYGEEYFDDYIKPKGCRCVKCR